MKGTVVRHLVSFLSLSFTALVPGLTCGGAGAALEGFRIPSEALAPRGGRVQGIALGADAVRLVVTEAGGGEKAHIFAFNAL